MRCQNLLGPVSNQETRIEDQASGEKFTYDIEVAHQSYCAVQGGTESAAAEGNQARVGERRKDPCL